MGQTRRSLQPTVAPPPPVAGVLVVDKPSGPTSHDVVAVARRALGERRIGHTGTLDPMASGVLPLACGEATRLVRFLSASDKAYTAVVRFGASTDTYDAAGAEVARTGRTPDRRALEQAVASLCGNYAQMPPPFSAKKVAGCRAYDLARRRLAVDLKPVPVHVARAEVLGFDGTDATIAIVCSAGFYVRSFAHELGVRTGAGAYLQALRRTRSGAFGLELAIPLAVLRDDPEAARQRVVPTGRLLPELPAVCLNAQGARRVAHGQDVRPSDLDGPRGQAPPWADGRPGQWVRLFDEGGRLLALATPAGHEGVLHPAVVLI